MSLKKKKKKEIEEPIMIEVSGRYNRKYTIGLGLINKEIYLIFYHPRGLNIHPGEIQPKKIGKVKLPKGRKNLDDLVIRDRIEITSKDEEVNRYLKTARYLGSSSFSYL